MAIIRQIASCFAIPDMRNASTISRLIILSTIACFLLPILSYPYDSYMEMLIETVSWAVPMMIFSTLLGFPLCHRLSKHPLGPFFWYISHLPIFAVTEYFMVPPPHHYSAHFVQFTVFFFLCMYIEANRIYKLQPALSEARLTALTARIRPHFLFNSLNAAISLIRLRPYDAETLLENLANLFRAQLKDGNQNSTLGQEIEWAQEYIAIEQIRMGHTRLQVMWQHNAPDNAITPHLLLQPLLENAVFHGVESSHRPGLISVLTKQERNWIYICIENPYIPPSDPNNAKPHKGNSMALVNLKERLSLLYDKDAWLKCKQEDGVFRVDIRIPYRKKEQSDVQRLFG